MIKIADRQSFGKSLLNTLKVHSIFVHNKILHLIYSLIFKNYLNYLFIPHYYY